jgi:hypothetical protein
LHLPLRLGGNFRRFIAADDIVRFGRSQRTLSQPLSVVPIYSRLRNKMF